MALDLSTIKIKVDADTQQADSKLDKMSEAGEKLSGVSAGITAAFAAATVATVVLGTEIKRNADMLGMSTDEYQQADAMMQKFGWSMEDAKGDVVALSERVMEAANGNEDYSSAFDHLGVSIKDSQGNLRGTNDILIDTIKTLKNVEDPIERNSLAAHLLGTTFEELGGVVGMTDAEFDKLVNQPPLFSEEDIAQVEEFKEKFDLLKGQMMKMAITIGTALMPVIEAVMGVFTNLLNTFNNLNPGTQKVIIGLTGLIAAIAPVLIFGSKLLALFAGFPLILPIIGGTLLAIGTSLLGTSTEFQKFVTELPAKMGLALDGLLQKALAYLPQMATTAFNLVVKFLEGFVTGFPLLLDFIVNTMTTLITKIFEYAPQFLAKGIEIIKNLLDGMIQKFPELLGKLLEGLLNVLKNIADKMPEFLQKGIDFVVNMINGIASNLPAIVAKIAELLGKLILKIVEYLPKFLAEGAKIVAQIISGILSRVGDLVGAGANLIKSCWNACVGAVGSFLNIGSKIVQNIKQGVANAWGSLTGWISGKLKSIPIIGGLFSLPTPQQPESGLTPAIATGYGTFNSRTSGDAYGIGMNNIANRKARSAATIIEKQDNSSQTLNFYSTFNVSAKDKMGAEELTDIVMKGMEDKARRFGVNIKPVSKVRIK